MMITIACWKYTVHNMYTSWGTLKLKKDDGFVILGPK